ncbi:nitronate monooxygenase, partial [Burkholderia sola]|uniref:nitronate monooxygenase n=1 Tax=Burkholderia sola TaxID=2843302 RepID=UPI00338ECFB9
MSPADTADTAWMARLGMRHPIIQAPMAGTSTPALAAAVTDAGGLGSLGIGASGTEQARQQIVQTRALTSGAFNVNLFCHRPARADAQRE